MQTISIYIKVSLYTDIHLSMSIPRFICLYLFESLTHKSDYIEKPGARGLCLKTTTTPTLPGTPELSPLAASYSVSSSLPSPPCLWTMTEQNHLQLRAVTESSHFASRTFFFFPAANKARTDFLMYGLQPMPYITEFYYLHFILKHSPV